MFSLSVRYSGIWLQYYFVTLQNSMSQIAKKNVGADSVIKVTFCVPFQNNKSQLAWSL